MACVSSFLSCAPLQFVTSLLLLAVPTPTNRHSRGSGTGQSNVLPTTRSTGASSASLFRGSASVSFLFRLLWSIIKLSHPSPVLPCCRYHNYHLFSFVPVQERLSGRVLDTAYLGAAGLWIPVMQELFKTVAAIRLSVRRVFGSQCFFHPTTSVSLPSKIPNMQALAHSVQGNEVHILARRSN